MEHACSPGILEAAAEGFQVQGQYRSLGETLKTRRKQDSMCTAAAFLSVLGLGLIFVGFITCAYLFCVMASS